MTVLHQGRVFAEGTIDRDHRACRTCATSIWDGPEMAAILSASDLRAGYATGDVLQGVSVEVGPGEVVGVLGRNGVGKSTLMKALIGLLPRAERQHPLQGRRHHAAKARDRRARRGIGYVPQGREIFPHMTRAGQSADGTVRQPSVQATSTLDRGVRAVSPFSASAWPARRHPVRRTAGDACDRPRSVNGPSCCFSTSRATACSPRSCRRSAAFITELVRRRPIGVLIVEQNIDLMQTVAQRAYVMDKGRVVASSIATSSRIPNGSHPFLAV